MTEFHAEHMRPLEDMHEPDPRWRAFGRITPNGVESISLERYAKPIQEIQLNNAVPESVVTHFETAKNLALFAWHVYRFVPVAQLHAFISVELALREKTGNNKAPFKKLLQRSIDEGWLSNERFSQWRRITERRALQHKEDLELAKVLDREAPEEPKHWDYLAVLKEYMEVLGDVGILEKTSFIIGLGPFTSAKSAKWMNDNLFGVDVPDEIIKRLEQAKDQKEESKKICLELIQIFREIKGVKGIHLMGHKKEEVIAEIIKESKIS